MEVKGSGTGCQEEKRLISSRYPVSLPSRKEKRESCQINKAISCEQAINPITWNVLQQKSRENWREKIGEKKVSCDMFSFYLFRTGSKWSDYTLVCQTMGRLNRNVRFQEEEGRGKKKKETGNKCTTVCCLCYSRILGIRM